MALLRRADFAAKIAQFHQVATVNPPTGRCAGPTRRDPAQPFSVARDNPSVPIRQPIYEIQGREPLSPFEGEDVVTRGVVTAVRRNGFTLQDPVGDGDPETSDAVFVYAPRGTAERLAPGDEVEVAGRVASYAQTDGDNPVTQIRYQSVERLGTAPLPEPVWLDEALLDPDAQVTRFRALEHMRVGLRGQGAFRAVAPSNPYADYVVAPKDYGPKTRFGGLRRVPGGPGVLLSFRVAPELRANAPAINVGAALESAVVGVMRYRSGAYQFETRDIPEFSAVPVHRAKATLRSTAERFTVLVLNCFNLDAHVERRDRVDNPRDIDDDLGAGRFDLITGELWRARWPDIVLLMEMERSRGAERIDADNPADFHAALGADQSFQALLDAIARAGGPRYAWTQANPNGDDGGKPNAHIRNGFLYRVDGPELLGPARRLGEDEAAFAGSRNPVVADFEALHAMVVHNTSKRGKQSVFALDEPGQDPRSATRLQQGVFQAEHLRAMAAAGNSVLIAGDFNAHPDEPSVQAIVSRGAVNLLEQVPEDERHTYNHRGFSQVLLQALVDEETFKRRDVRVEILHGNDLEGVKPGDSTPIASDHAPVLLSFLRAKAH